jgi:hypothetical protein
MCPGTDGTAFSEDERFVARYAARGLTDALR